MVNQNKGFIRTAERRGEKYSCLKLVAAVRQPRRFLARIFVSLYLTNLRGLQHLTHPSSACRAAAPLSRGRTSLPEASHACRADDPHGSSAALSGALFCSDSSVVVVFTSAPLSSGKALPLWWLVQGARASFKSVLYPGCLVESERHYVHDVVRLVRSEPRARVGSSDVTALPHISSQSAALRPALWKKGDVLFVCLEGGRPEGRTAWHLHVRQRKYVLKYHPVNNTPGELGVLGRGVRYLKTDLGLMNVLRMWTLRCSAGQDGDWEAKGRCFSAHEGR